MENHNEDTEDLNLEDWTARELWEPTPVYGTACIRTQCPGHIGPNKGSAILGEVACDQGHSVCTVNWAWLLSRTSAFSYITEFKKKKETYLDIDIWQMDPAESQQSNVQKVGTSFNKWLVLLVKWSEILVAQSCPALCNAMGCGLPGDFPGKNTRVGSHSLLQRIFLTQDLPDLQTGSPALQAVFPCDVPHLIGPPHSFFSSNFFLPIYLRLQILGGV